MMLFIDSVRVSVTTQKKLPWVGWPVRGISPSGTPLPFPMALSDTPLIDYLGSYGSVEIENGIKHTYDSFLSLIKQGQIDASDLG